MLVLSLYSLADQAMIYVISLTISAEFISIIAFAIMPNLTYRRYFKTHCSDTYSHYSLSLRYQESENYKSSKLLRNVLYTIGITDIFCGASWLADTLLNGHGDDGIFDLLMRGSLFSQVGS